MEARPGTNPGTFKEKLNRAGQAFFVAPELVRGTLGKGFEFSSFDAARDFLTKANAFEEPTDARLVDDVEP